MILENSMPNKEINHNKGELGCVPESLLKRYHETSKVNIEIYHTTCIFVKYDQTIKQISKQSSMTPNKGNDMHIHEISESVVVESIPGQQTVR